MYAAKVDYAFPVRTPPPGDYPAEPTADTHAAEPFAAEFGSRREAFLDHVRRNPAPANLKAPYHEMARLAAGGRPHVGIFYAALDYVDARKDCADFVLHAILRLLYQFADRLEAPLLDRARRTVLSFKYWPDEPGRDSMCTWTENHQILFASAAYLAGQLYPDEAFSNAGQTGREKMAVHRARIERWLDLRFRTGFSEWLSNVYYDQDLTALVNLVDFCRDAEIQQRAAMVVDLLLFDVALNSFRGVFGSSHGRSYEAQKKWAAAEDAADTQKLLFGRGRFSLEDSMSAVCLALSERYRMPRVLYEIANDLDRAEMVNRQRMGIRLAEAARWGLGFDDLEDAMVLLSLEAYAHPRTINLFARALDAFDWWHNAFFEPFAARRGLIEGARRLGLLPLIARLFERDLTRNTREEVQIYTYRTPDYLLSSAQDYRPGYGGDQQHIWQATLGPDAVCFTTHPARREGPSPNYWTGSGSLPRVAQVENVVIAIYNVDTRPGLYVTHRLRFTHAWLPRDRFDEVIEQGGWIMARRGDSYLALRSQQPYHWQSEPGEDQGREVIAPGKQNVWICELGRRAVDGPFDDFVRRIAGAELLYRRLGVRYHSPSQGKLEFGWRGPLRQDGEQVSPGDYPRYDNPYTRADFPADQMTIRHGGHHLALDWQTGERQSSASVK
ncbi:MAG: hypothetical protein PVJ34_14125 [Anaerolineae bacterium]|jgi:hypothetical protein